MTDPRTPTSDPQERMTGAPGFCFDIDGNWWNKHGPGSGCPYCDAPARTPTSDPVAAARKRLTDGRVKTDHLSVPSIIETYANRLLDLHYDDADRASIVEERDDLLAWYAVFEAEARQQARAAFAAHPGGQREFRTTCQRCGEPGFLHVSLIGPDETVTIAPHVAASPEPDKTAR